jgi:hypothetical protein
MLKANKAPASHPPLHFLVKRRATLRNALGHVLTFYVEDRVPHVRIELLRDILALLRGGRGALCHVGVSQPINLLLSLVFGCHYVPAEVIKLGGLRTFPFLL